MAKINVVVPIKDAAPYLCATLDGFLNQDFFEWKAFLLDHSSSDGSAEIIADYVKRDSRFVHVDASECLDVSHVRNMGLELCDAEIVIFSDADDISLSSRFRLLYDAHLNNPEVVAIGSCAYVIDNDGKQTGEMDIPLASDVLSFHLFFRTPIFQPAASVKLSLLRKFSAKYGTVFVDGFSYEGQSVFPCVSEDYLFFGQLGLVAPLMNLPERLVLYRWHSGNISNRKRSSQLDNASRISDALALSFSSRVSCRPFTPSLFSDHGNRVSKGCVEDFSYHFNLLKEALLAEGRQGKEIEEEISYRYVLATRSKFLMLIRFAYFVFVFPKAWRRYKTVAAYLLNRS